MLRLILFSAIFLFAAPRNAHAYIDPGTGSYITQIVIGFVAGGVFVFKKQIGGVINYFKDLLNPSQNKKDNATKQD